MPDMGHGYKNPNRPREAPKKGPPLGLVIVLAVAGGLVIGSASTYFLIKRPGGPQQSASAAPGGATQAQTITMAPQQQFKPAPQPPGEVPPGKVWSVEHGHWHDAPVASATPAAAPATVIPVSTPATATPASAPATATPAPTPATVTPAATPPPAPAAAPAEKKQ